MRQKNTGYKNNMKSCIFLMAAFLALGVFKVSAEEAETVNPGALGPDLAVGTPAGEIVAAVSSGGIETKSDMKEIQSIINDQTDETPVSAAEVPASSAPSVGFNSESIQTLEEKGGLSSKPEIPSDTPTAFNLAVKFFERVVFKKDVEFSSRPTFDQGLEISGAPTFDKDTAGYAIIKKDNQSVAVEFENNYDAPPIITATLSLQQYKDAEVRAAAEDLLLISDVKYIVTNVTKKGFEIMMDRKADSDIPFSWHALAVDNPKISKKKGSSLDGQAGYPPFDVKSAESGNSSDILPLDAGSAAVPSFENSSAGGRNNNAVENRSNNSNLP